MDVERLILIIEQYKALYDTKDRNYSNAERREEIWREIGDLLNERADICKEKWRRIRDNYRKARNLRKTKSGVKIKPIKYDQELSFLNPFLEPTPGSEDADLSPNLTKIEIVNWEDGYENEGADVSSDGSEKVKIKTETTWLPASPHTSSAAPSPSPIISSSDGRPSRSTKRKEQSPPSEQNLSFKKLQEQFPADPLDTFFSSLAQTVKTFPKHLQLTVKQQLFSVVNNAERSLLNQSSGSLV